MAMVSAPSTKDHERTSDASQECSKIDCMSAGSEFQPGVHIEYDPEIKQSFDRAMRVAYTSIHVMRFTNY